MRMRNIAITTLALAAVFLFGQPGRAEHGHVLLNPDDIKWGDAPPVLPPGAKAAVLKGDPAGKEIFAVAAKLPANYKIPAHSHPTDEHVVVVSGALYMGLGDKLDADAAKPVKPGGFMVAPAKVNHFAFTKEETVIVVFAMGPLEFNYVNPDDDPRKKK
jgi:uncharacterized RmlC-like cupin family protein